MTSKTIFLAGDSTVATNYIDTYPQAGWGQALYLYLPAGTEVRNFAKNGTSSRSFIEEGLLSVIDAEMKAGDFLLVQFGHNDQKKEAERHTDPFTSYREYLSIYIEAARFKGATPILVTSMYRRHFDADGKLKPNVHSGYPEAMKELGARLGVGVIDLCEASRELIESLGDAESKKYFMHIKPGEYGHYPKGLEDDTHLRHEGAIIMAGLAAKGLGAFTEVRSETIHGAMPGLFPDPRV